jgi:two-component system OmpR family response regulator
VNSTAVTLGDVDERRSSAPFPDRPGHLLRHAAFQTTFRELRYKWSVHLLVVEDDPKLGRLLSRLFANDRHVVDLATKGLEAIELLEANPGFDAVILDVGLPGMDGFEVARHVRSTGSRIPILMLTARDGLSDRVTGLDAGADDYLVKPFAYEELAARLRAICRRIGAAGHETGPHLQVGPIILDETRRAVTVAGKTVDLTLREFALLECLLRHPGHALSRDQLLDMAWPFGVAVTPNTVDAFVTFLRRKLGPVGAARIETVRGIGYRMADA